ncbi:hypothetical protein LTR53_008232 [Teratosphaeriaceae sp. CCFEE 6253]|nr:hypothetical protein LTR53_008232 [Teratosphaeriaceae sp. CCFEE 6253]
MQLLTTLGALACYIQIGDSKPVAEPAVATSPELRPANPIDLATDDTGIQNTALWQMPASPVTLARRSAPVTINNVVYPTGYPDLVPSSTVDLATDSTHLTQDVSPIRNLVSSSLALAATPTSSTTTGRIESVTASPETIDGLVYPTGFPDLVPSTTINMATDSTFTTQEVSPTRVAASSATATTALDDSSEAKTVTSGAIGLRPRFAKWSDLIRLSEAHLVPTLAPN